MRGIQSNTMILCAPGNRGASLFPEGRTYSPPAKQAVVSLPLVRLVRSSQSVFQPLFQRGQAMSQANIPCAVGSIFCTISKTMRWHIATPSRRLPAKTCHRQLYRRYGQQCSPFSLCKEKQKPRGGVLPPPHKIRIEVNANGNLPLGGKGGQPGSRTLRLCSLRLSQLLPHPQ